LLGSFESRKPTDRAGGTFGERVRYRFKKERHHE